MKHCRQQLLFVLFMIGWMGCAIDSGPIWVKNGKEYGRISEIFRDQWWNYYERALSYAEGEFFVPAAADLKEAIRQRSTDQRRARTYGMHFIDYFPHRELGIIYYQTGDLNQAEIELELSMRQFPTAKARFYLDRVRKAKLEMEKQPVLPPTITLDVDADEIRTAEDPVMISGIAEDKHYVSEITVHGISVALEQSQKQARFTEPIRLANGIHPIEITAKNLFGQMARKRLTIHVDREPPLMTIQTFEAVSDGRMTLTGSVFDPSGIRAIHVDNRPIRVNRQQEIEFSEIVWTNQNHIELSAEDVFGNRISVRLNVDNASQSQVPVMLASTYTDKPLLSWLFGKSDKTPPVILVKDWRDIQTVLMDKAYLQGEIRDESSIVNLRVNHTPLWRRAGKLLFFSHIVELAEGRNDIRIEAEDAAGNIAEKTITIIRQIPKALQIEERMSMTVIPFEDRQSISPNSIFFQDSLIHALIKQNRFRIVERQRLDAVLKEQQLSQSRLIKTDSAIELGRIIAARSILTGSILETRNGIEIVGRVIDTETTDILAVGDVYDEAKDFSALRALSEGMAIQLHREFPLVDGMVVDQKDRFVFINLGQDKTKLHRRFIVFREQPIIDQPTGAVLGLDANIIGHARIVQVMPDMSKAELYQSGNVQCRDKVISE